MAEQKLNEARQVAAAQFEAGLNIKQVFGDQPAHSDTVGRIFPFLTLT